MGAARSSIYARNSLEADSQHRQSKSVISSPGDESLTVTVGLFPSKLTATLAALKIVGGCMLIGLGAAAIVQHAGYARVAGGIWAGVLVIISGVLGAYTVRTRASRVYVVLYLVASLVSLIASVVLIIYSASGLAQDAGQPYGVVRTEEGQILPTPDINISSREAAMLINTLLIILGFLDVIFSIPSIIICLRYRVYSMVDNIINV